VTKSTTSSRRSPEGGTIAVLVGVSFTALLAMSALAVDAGYMYQARRNLQAAADAAVMAGLPDLKSSTSTAKSNAATMASNCGYTTGVTTATSTTGTKLQLLVTITSTQNLFFGRLFGVSSKTMTVQSIGESDMATPALFAGTTNCSVPGGTVGVALNGTFTVNGNIESNGGVETPSGVSSGDGNTYSEIYKPTCTCQGCPSPSNTGGTAPSPFSWTPADFTCGTGSMTGGNLNLTGSVSGVYCSGGWINISASNISGTATFVAVGTITFSSSTVTLTAAQNGIIAYSQAAGNCISNQAIGIGNSSVIMNGSFYAPSGCVNTSGANITINGSLVGNEVQLGSSNTTITASGGGTASYDLYQ
jgi:hypothetical protein